MVDALQNYHEEERDEYGCRNRKTEGIVLLGQLILVLHACVLHKEVILLIVTRTVMLLVVEEIFEGKLIEHAILADRIRELLRDLRI